MEWTVSRVGGGIARGGGGCKGGGGVCAFTLWPALNYHVKWVVHMGCDGKVFLLVGLSRSLQLSH